MPYEGEFASYGPLKRIAESDRVKTLLKKARTITPASNGQSLVFMSAPTGNVIPPEFAVAIDGSHAEVDVKNGYPGAKVGYITVASVLLDLKRIDELDEGRPVDPREFRKTEEASTLDAASRDAMSFSAITNLPLNHFVKHYMKHSSTWLWISKMLSLFSRLSKPCSLNGQRTHPLLAHTGKVWDATSHL